MLKNLHQYLGIWKESEIKGHLSSCPTFNNFDIFRDLLWLNSDFILQSSVKAILKKSDKAIFQNIVPTNRRSLPSDLRSKQHCSVTLLMVTQFHMSNFMIMVYRIYVFSKILWWIYFVVISRLNSPEYKDLLFVVLEMFAPVIAVDILLSDTKSQKVRMKK